MVEMPHCISLGSPPSELSMQAIYTVAQEMIQGHRRLSLHAKVEVQNVASMIGEKDMNNELSGLCHFSAQ